MPSPRRAAGWWVPTLLIAAAIGWGVRDLAGRGPSPAPGGEPTGGAQDEAALHAYLATWGERSRREAVERLDAAGETVEVLVARIEASPRHWRDAFGKLAIRGTPQADDPRLAARLGAALRRAGVLADVSENERYRRGWPYEMEAYELAGQTRDPGMIPLLRLRLNDRTVRCPLGGYPDRISWYAGSPWAERPPPQRVCDMALDALLVLRGQDLAAAYAEAGWSLAAHRRVGLPPGRAADASSQGLTAEEEARIDAERSLWADRLRDRMIERLLRELPR